MDIDVVLRKTKTNNTHRDQSETTTDNKMTTTNRKSTNHAISTKKEAAEREINADICMQTNQKIKIRNKHHTMQTPNNKTDSDYKIARRKLQPPKKMMQ